MNEKTENYSTLSQDLSERRKLLEIDLKELSRKSGVPVKYLRRIEKGEWRRLPSAVYTKGFLKKYAWVVGANPEEIIKRYQREILKEEESRQDKREAGQTFKEKLLQILNVSPKTFRLVILVVVFVIVLGYIGFQLSAVFFPPKLTVSEPVGEEIVVGEDSLVLMGRISESADLFLNNKPMSLKPGGFFEERVELLPGLNVFELKAVSRFKKETIITRRVIYKQ